jgi:glycosyltransferase 2 family protein
MKNAFKRRNLLRWLPGLFISIVALVLVFRLANKNDFTKAFEALQPINLLIAVVLTVISLGARAMAWRTLLEGKTSLSKSFFTINIGYLLNNIFPLRAGEIGRAIFMGRSSGLGTLHVISTIVIERAFDVAIAAITLLSTLTLVSGMEAARPVAMVTLVLVLLGLLALYLAARYYLWIQTWVERLAHRWNWFNRLVLPRIGSLLEGLQVLTSPARFFQALFWMVVCWLLAFVSYWEMLLSISPTSPLWHGAFVDSVLAMGIAIPSAPGAIGIFEASITAAVNILGVTVGAIGYAFLMHLFAYILTGILGFWGLMSEGRSLSSAMAEIQTSEQ